MHRCLEPDTYVLSENLHRGRHDTNVQHSGTRFKRAEYLMQISLAKAQRFDSKANAQDQMAAKDNKIHLSLLRAAQIASNGLKNDIEHTRKIELLR